MNLTTNNTYNPSLNTSNYNARNTKIDSRDSNIEVILPSEVGTLDKDAFLKMLLTQLQNQDPLNPMDNTEFASQMAQFSTLEQLSNMSTQLSSLSTIGKQLEEVIGLLKKEDSSTSSTNKVETETSTDKVSNKEDLTKVTIKHEFDYNNSEDIANVLSETLKQFSAKSIY